MEGRSAADDVGRCQGPRGRGQGTSETEDHISAGHHLPWMSPSLEMPPLWRCHPLWMPPTGIGCHQQALDDTLMGHHPFGVATLFGCYQQPSDVTSMGHDLSRMPPPSEMSPPWDAIPSHQMPPPQDAICLQCHPLWRYHPFGDVTPLGCHQQPLGATPMRRWPHEHPCSAEFVPPRRGCPVQAPGAGGSPREPPLRGGSEAGSHRSVAGRRMLTSRQGRAGLQRPAAVPSWDARTSPRPAASQPHRVWQCPTGVPRVPSHHGHPGDTGVCPLWGVGGMGANAAQP